MRDWAFLLGVLCAAVACGDEDPIFGGTSSASNQSAANTAGSGASGGSGGSGQGGVDPAQDPVAQINHPGDMQCRHPGNAFDCAGTGVDPQDGMLTGAALVWTSNLDGAIGKGENVSFTPTTEGNHVITLTVTDSDGNIGTDEVTQLIAQQCP